MMTDEKTAKMLERVRALIAKADSTTFPEEAETFRAKADELMTQYSIGQWQVDMAQAGQNVRQEPVRRDFDRSWRNNKFRGDLLSMFGSLATHCRCVIGYRGADYTNHLMPVYGLPSDLDYLDLLYTSLTLEVSKNLQPSVNPLGEVGHEVFKQRQAGIAWPEITRKVYNSGLIKLTPREREKSAINPVAGEENPSWERLYDATRTDIKNRLANYNRRYVKDNGLQMDRNYVKPDIYQRSFMLGFAAEIRDRLHRMGESSRAAYDATHDSGSMALAVRDIHAQAMTLYEQEFPPPPPVEPDPNYKPPKGKALRYREVAVDYGAMGAGRQKAREVNLVNNPNRGIRSTPEIDR